MESSANGPFRLKFRQRRVIISGGEAETIVSISLPQNVKFENEF